MKPVPACSNDLPSTMDLCDAPQLAVLATLQSNLRVASQVLDIRHPETGSLANLVPDPRPTSILAQLIIDRSRELSELLSCYRLSLTLPSEPPPDNLDDLPF